MKPIPKAIATQKRRYERKIPATTAITNENYRTLLYECTEKKLKEDKVVKPQAKRRIVASNGGATIS